MEEKKGDGAEKVKCYTFCWAGSPDSKELEEGVFDFERYQRYFKPSVVGDLRLILKLEFICKR